MYLFGGFEQIYIQTDGKSTFYNDMWSYDVSTNTWTQLPQPSKVPEVRRNRWTYDCINNGAIIFGGDGPWNTSNGEFTHYGDTWIYDFSSNTWTEIITDPVPSPRHMNLIMCDPVNGKILLYGGTDKPPMT